MRFRATMILLVLLTTNLTSADPPNLAFKPAGEGFFEFDTGLLKGRLKLDGKYQGLYPLIDIETGTELVHAPGAFSFYRVLTTNHRYGKSARDWPTQTKLLSNGAVEVRWAPAEEHPLAMTGVYRWTAPDTLDLDIAVTPRQDMPHFELFMSSYFGKGFRGSVWLKPEDKEQPRFVRIDRTPESRGGYVMFPRDEEALGMIRDGRWAIPPNPVDWDARRWLAAPVVFRRDDNLGLTAVLMCPPDDCFAIASPWNPAAAKAGGYRSLYQCLFGRDLVAGETVRASCRLVLRRNLANDEVMRLYGEYRPGY